MNLVDSWQTLTQHYAPLLPSAQSLVWARHLLWSLVLAALGLLWVSRLDRAPALRRWLPWGLALWAWVPGPWGVSYWLALSFQIPSLTSGFLATGVLLQGIPSQPRPLTAPGAKPATWTGLWSLAAVGLGAVLLLDAFAVFTVAIYPWGFTPMALALAWGFALLPFVVSGSSALRQAGVGALCAALLVFTLTRWPSGNVWDAVLDPWLWLLALGALLRRPWRHR